ncbi:MAG: FAD-dependent oxidoreductase, partial [Propionicimonas sp.]|nr:FAD-dependent oxidoreductase [Propionicimonas sp.]
MQHFDLCVIGSGSGNAVATKEFADRSVAIVDGAPWFGGTCLSAGCIPSKMLAYPADVAEVARHGAALGIDVPRVQVRWPELRERVLNRVDRSAEAAERQRERHARVTVFRDQASFVGQKRLLVGEDVLLSADQFVVAAGSRPRVPDLPGIEDPAVLGGHRLGVGEPL